MTSRFTVEQTTVQLPGNRSLRIRLSRDPSGEPDGLVFETGWDGPFRADGHHVHLPGYVLTEVRAALESLEATQ